MIVWRLGGKIIRTVCAVFCTTVVQNNMHTHIWTVFKLACWFRFRYHFCMFV